MSGSPASSEPARAAAEAALVAIDPWDEVERAHRDDALTWVRSGAGIWRTAKPATPPEHLVSYFLLVDPDAGACLLVDHRKAQRWLPTGGHVEPGEHPATTVSRECVEELGIPARLLDGVPNPFFVTRTVTGGLDPGHTDVSLWYLLRATVDTPLTPDPTEFHAARWFPLSALPTPADPHLPRLVAKLAAAGPLR
jgi:8-oxo-dGTP pyrophosphatase MutT (NUDIX family)